jgi:hypothetical protein
MALPQDAMDTIRRIQNKGVSTPQQRNSLIEETKETYKQSADPLLRMFPIPEVKDTLLYYKVDLFVIPDVDDNHYESAYLKVQLRTEASVDYNYLKEDSTTSGTKGFKSYKSSVRTNNEHNRPSTVIDKQLIPHPFYQEVIATRKEIMQKHKKSEMLIKPYLSNFYEPNNKNAGTYDFCSSIVSWENGEDPEVYVRIGDWEFHETIELTHEKIVNKRMQMIFTSKKTIRRDYNPKRRSL